MKKDHCTWFPESWFGVDISECCKKHDEDLSTTRFYKCLSSKIDWFSAGVITLGGFAGAFIKYSKTMLKRI